MSFDSQICTLAWVGVLAVTCLTGAGLFALFAHVEKHVMGLQK